MSQETPGAVDAPREASGHGVKRYFVLTLSVVMLAFLGTNQAWSVFVEPLKAAYGISKAQTQEVFSTATVVFCLVMILAGRLHDRFGPRPLSVVSAAIVGAGWFLAWAAGGNFFLLWLAVGVLISSGAAVGYVPPLATALKWFPEHRGLVSGLAAAGFACGPILLSNLSEMLFRHGWHVLQVFGFVGCVYAPVILATGLCLTVPPGKPAAGQLERVHSRELFRDSRFWTLFTGMLFGTLPYLVVMGCVKSIALSFGLGAAAAATVSVTAAGNVAGRIFWGFAIGRLGPRRSMLTAQSVMVASMLCLVLGGSTSPALFFVSVFAVGSCYGSNFAIYPTTVARLYGTHVLGSVYSLVMAAQGVSAIVPVVNGLLYDMSGSYLPGLSVAAGLAVVGILVCAVLARSLAQRPVRP